MFDMTFHGVKINRVVKNKNEDGAAGPYVRMEIVDRHGSVSELWFFMEDQSAFNEINDETESSD
jgi:hypothetical protein